MILHGSLFSSALEMETGISIISSNHNNGIDNRKIVYLLHGICGRSSDWINYTMLPLYANQYNAIFVMPEVARSFYTDMKFGQKFFTYITEELPKLCKDTFNFSAERENTVIIGASMGGYGALKAAMTKPEQYGYCCAFSSPCLFLKEGLDYQRQNVNTDEFRAIYNDRIINDFESIFGTDLEWSAKYEILDLAKAIQNNPIKPKLYTSCGTEDYMYESNVRFRDEMQMLNFDYQYEEWQGMHDWNFFNEALKKALDWSLLL